MLAVWYETPYTLRLDVSDSKQDLCHAALRFSTEVLKTGGHFVCKFYQGAEDKELEQQLRDLFKKVHRLKPESSRSVRFALSNLNMLS
jgi:23S rRNA U2552 (ribose-2'-O)-methylase RlmE/FtsJ